MSESVELNKIKKMYGEKFMKLCRELFPTLLNDGTLYELLSSSFSENCKTLYEDITNSRLEGDLKNYIYSKVDVEKENKIITNKTPYELLEEAGYDLIECSTEEEIQEFKKYYTQGEELCTFRGGRLDRCVVFFAVKKDADDIKREDFKSPKREDEYGTSVMGIQFNRKGVCTVSIKNRYNHTVNNPDATYGNDLDKIIPGLTQSFADLLLQQGLKLDNSNKENFSIPGYTVANDGKYYKFNTEIDGNYYCPGNIIIKNGEVTKLEKPERQILIDNFILDIENKTIQLYDETRTDSFTDALQNLGKIEIKKDKERGNGIKIITIQKKDQETPIIIEIDKNNQIIGYKNNELTQAGNDFLPNNKTLTQLELPSLIHVGDHFLHRNKTLTQLELPSLTHVGDHFLSSNLGLTQLELPNLTYVGSYFLSSNRRLTQLELPSLTHVGDHFLDCNQTLTQLELPSLIHVGNHFLQRNQTLTQLELPNLTHVGNLFLYTNRELTQLELPNLTYVGSHFLHGNQTLTQLELPNLTHVGDYFLLKNKTLTQLELPNLTHVGDCFLFNNKTLTQLKLPNLTQIEHCTFSENREDVLTIINKNLEQQKTKPQEEKNNPTVNLWTNRFSNWYSIMDRVTQSAKNKFVKMKSNIIKAISGKLKERTNHKQEDAHGQDSNGR